MNERNSEAEKIKWCPKCYHAYSLECRTCISCSGELETQELKVFIDFRGNVNIDEIKICTTCKSLDFPNDGTCIFCGEYITSFSVYKRRENQRQLEPKKKKICPACKHAMTADAFFCPICFKTPLIWEREIHNFERLIHPGSGTKESSIVVEKIKQAIHGSPVYLGSPESTTIVLRPIKIEPPLLEKHIRAYTVSLDLTVVLDADSLPVPE